MARRDAVPSRGVGDVSMNDADETQVFPQAGRRGPAPAARLVCRSPIGAAPSPIRLVGAGVSLACGPGGRLEPDAEAPNLRFFQMSGAWGVKIESGALPITVNGAAMTLSFLKAEDEIEVGGVRWVFRLGADPAPEDTAEVAAAVPDRRDEAVPTVHRAPPSAPRRWPRRAAWVVLGVVTLLALGFTLT
jgi:hypothetical protein